MKFNRTISILIIVFLTGSGRDIGYVRSIQIPDGNMVTVYYFEEKPNPERFIECAIWNPGYY